MDNNLDRKFFGHSLHGAMMLDTAEKMHAKASSENVNVFGCPNIMRYFIPQSAPSLCETSAAVSGVNMGIKDVRVHAPITCIKLGIPIYFVGHSEFITVQCKEILS